MDQTKALSAVQLEENRARKEKGRVAGLQSRLDRIAALSYFEIAPPSSLVETRLEQAKTLDLDDSWQEKLSDAALAQTRAVRTLQRLLQERRSVEAAERFAAEQWREAEERARAAREERIAADDFAMRQQDREKAVAEAKARAEANRQANIAHRASVHAAAAKSLIEQCGLDEETAGAVVTAIGELRIQHLKVIY